MRTEIQPRQLAGGDAPDGRGEYLRGLARRQHEPVLRIRREPLADALEIFGAKGISVPDVMEPFQISWSLYIGASTPRAASEVPHWHPDQTEAYVVLSGHAHMLAKYRWEDEWVRREAHAGDLLVVQPEVCHWFRWQSPEGLALIFKAPQRAGIGPYPAGKSVCKHCPHYQRGCVLPEGFAPVG